MNTEYSYWYYRNAIPKRICNDIIEYGLQNAKQSAVIADKKLNQKIRKSNVAWLDEQWIYKEIVPYIEQANIDAGWNYHISRSEMAQFTMYEPGQFYDWHVDAWTKPYKKGENWPHLEGLYRKLSVTVCLNDTTEYEDGQLEMGMNARPDHNRDIHDLRPLSTQGTVIVFPSYEWHRVQPVTKGTRYSLVVWMFGDPFK